MEPQRTAIIVVHGVGDPAPGQTARSVASSLAAADPSLGHFLRRDFPISIESTRHEVVSYRNDAFDIIEMYWGDLSRPNGSGFGALIDLHELAVFLPRIGSRALKTLWQRTFQSRNRLFGIARTAHEIAAYIVAPLAPLLAFVTFAVAMQLFVLEIVAEDVQLGRGAARDPSQVPATIWALDLCAILIVLGVARALEIGGFSRAGYDDDRLVWLQGSRRWFAWIAPLLHTAVAFVVTYFLHSWMTADPVTAVRFAVAISYFLVCLVGGVIVVRREFQPREPSSMSVYFALVGFGALLTLAAHEWISTQHPPFDRSEQVRQFAAALVATVAAYLGFAALVWVLKVGIQLVALISVALSSLACPGDDARLPSTTRRVGWLSALTLAVSSWIFFAATAIIYLTGLELGREQLSQLDVSSLADFGIVHDRTSAADHLDWLLGQARSALLVYWTAFFGVLAVVLALLALAPLPLGENERFARRLGPLVVDSAYLGLALPSVLIMISTLTPLGALLLPLASVEIADFSMPTSLLSIARAAVVLALGTGGGLFVMRERLARYSPQLSSMLDLAFDVERYVRDEELEANRNDGQSVSLRRRLKARMDAILAQVRADGVSQILVVAHSQGTVISADYLLTRDDASDHERTKLLTFGSPLRALYHWAFPDYDWIERHYPGNPGDLRIAAWWNRWCHGDYVGRWIARDAGHEVSDSDRELGSGAHMGYWRSAKIAEAILQLAALPPSGDARSGTDAGSDTATDAPPHRTRPPDDEGLNALLDETPKES